MHEFGHVIAAKRTGCQIREVIMWPMGGLTLGERPSRWHRELVIAGAAPLVNLLLAPAIFLFWYWFGYYKGGDISQMLWSVGWANIGILLFNLLPIWPMDGGRIAQAAMEGQLGVGQSTRQLDSCIRLCLGGHRLVYACPCVRGRRPVISPYFVNVASLHVVLRDAGIGTTLGLS